MTNREVMEGRTMIPSVDAPDMRMLEPGVWQLSVLTVDDYRVAREGSRWRVTCDATGVRLLTAPTLGMGVAMAKAHAKSRPGVKERPGVTRDELAAFIGSMEQADFPLTYFPLTYADMLLEQFEIRRKT